MPGTWLIKGSCYCLGNWNTCSSVTGSVFMTNGGLVSGPVVNGQTLSEVLALPARSFTPVEPPLIVAVYDVEDASEDEGANVAHRPTLS